MNVGPFYMDAHIVTKAVGVESGNHFKAIFENLGEVEVLFS